MSVILPTIINVLVHIENTRNYSTDSLFEGKGVNVPSGSYNSQIWLEKGVRSNILFELTGRKVLNKKFQSEWNSIFDKAYTLANFGRKWLGVYN